MKLTKMSLVAALLIGSSAFALDNVQISGNADVFYNTSDANKGDLFNKDDSAADIGLNLNVTADVMKNDMVSISAGAGYTVLTTLGLENNFVSNVWGGAHTLTTPTSASFSGNDNYGLNGVQVENASWMNEAWVAATAGNTTAKLGRMELDTPLAFTEKWTIEKNTFEAAVVINQDIPDTVLVGAFVGTGNGTETFGQNAQSNTQDFILGGTRTGISHATGAVVNGNGKFATYGTDGAYAAGVINNSFEPLTVQAWYYDVSHLVQAYWLQADYTSKAVPGLLAGAQYSAHELDTKSGLDGTSSNVYALMLGYNMKDMFTAKVSYSQVDKDFAAGFNTATATGTAQSKLYTEAWWNYGYVTQADTQSYNVTVTSPVNGLFDLGLYYTYADQAKATGPRDVTEFTATAGKSYGPLDLTVAYINADYGKVQDSSNTVQVYATLNF